MLAAENLGGVLLNARHNFAWLTGGKSNGIDLSSEYGAGFLFVRRDGKKFVLANNIEMPRLLEEEISATDFEPVEFAWEAEKSSSDFVFEKAKSLLEKNSEIASDLFLSRGFKPIESLITRCRYQLTEPEIERYRKLGSDAGKAVGSLFENIKTGETELEIARKAKSVLAEYNIDSIVTLVGADERIKKFRHPVPTENGWRKVLLIGICARRDGLIANLSRLACAGKIPDELQRKTEAVSRVHAQILSATQIGTSGSQLYQAAKNAYERENFAEEIYKHHQGGATGYQTRDWTAHPANHETVRLNQAFAWNPTITGTKSEETVLIKKDGIEILTASPNFPSVSVEVNGQPLSLQGILQL